MNWDAIGALSELIGAVAVIATLLYLATQVRQGTQAIRSTNLGTWINAQLAANSMMAQNADFHEDALSRRRELTDEERWRFATHMAAAFNTAEVVWLFHLARTVDDPFFESKMNVVKRSLDYPGIAAWWDDWADSYDPRFVEYVNGLRGDDA